MRFVLSAGLGCAIACAMIFAVEALPAELQGSSGLLIGFVVGMGLGWFTHACAPHPVGHSKGAM